MMQRFLPPQKKKNPFSNVVAGEYTTMNFNRDCSKRRSKSNSLVIHAQKHTRTHAERVADARDDDDDDDECRIKSFSMEPFKSVDFPLEKSPKYSKV